eukprot:jgi/Tetstr1/445654/TSEL_003459.t1
MYPGRFRSPGTQPVGAIKPPLHPPLGRSWSVSKGRHYIMCPVCLCGPDTQLVGAYGRRHRTISSWPTRCTDDDGDKASQCGGWARKNTTFRPAPDDYYVYSRGIIGERSGDSKERECTIRINSLPTGILATSNRCMSYMGFPDCVGYLPFGLEAADEAERLRLTKAAKEARRAAKKKDKGKA